MNLRRTSITDEVFKILHERITTFRYKSGELLPSQDKLAKELGVSRNTIREAVNRLATVGILTTKQGVGTVIQSNQARSFILQIFDEIKQTSKKDAVDIIVARYTVERSIVRLATVNIKKQQIAKLYDNLNAQKNAIKDNDVGRFTSWDLKFHLAIAEASGSKILHSLEKMNLELYKAIIPEIVFNPLHMNISYKSHCSIIDAIKMQNPTAADRHILDHILKVIERLPKTTRLLKFKKAMAISNK